MRTGVASIPLDYGTCPKWLFERMTKLSRAIIQMIVSEFGEEELLKRLSDPTWFQSFGSVLAFDWNSSGLTTTVTGAIKQGIRDLEKDLGIFMCGGKGKTSRKTPEQIMQWAYKLSFSQEQADRLVYSSKISAKVDNTAIQDGFQLYHHTFIFTRTGKWTVIQQGMNEKAGQARRYHWLSDNVKDFIEEPHIGISSDIKLKPLNLTSKESENNKKTSTELVTRGYRSLIKDLFLLREKQTRQPSLFNQNKRSKLKILEMPDDKTLPQLTGDLEFTKSKYLDKILFDLHEKEPKNFEQVLMEKGVGPMTVRALSLVSELVYGAKASYEDPARYSFTFGGKDGVPFPVNRPVYDKALDVIERGIKKSQLSRREKEKALRRFTKSF
ncbi:MAG: DUF763 domain-containing protein [Candidatus Portnoybacteria bacterium]|nr:DUF763 domain-containing protein [Candidatus Portnoybacteria bacterium]